MSRPAYEPHTPVNMQKEQNSAKKCQVNSSSTKRGKNKMSTLTKC